jgi:hypothetical protein
MTVSAAQRNIKTKSWANFRTTINEETNEALTFIVTKDNVGGCMEFTSLLSPVVEITGKVDADGAYDTNVILEYCERHGLKAGIPVKSNASLRGLGLGSDAVREQFGVYRKMRCGRTPNWLCNRSSQKKSEMQNE